MTTEEHDNLLQELTTEITTDRQLEILGALRTDKADSVNKYQELVDSADKLQKDYNSLKAKKVEEFFNVGVQGEPPKEDGQNTGSQQPEVKSVDEIVNELKARY